MKRLWTIDELAEHWTLSFDEVGLLKGKTRKARLGFCLQLKFYQQYLAFPLKAEDFPQSVVEYVVDQIDAVGCDLTEYDWAGRTARRHRHEIQEHLGLSSFDNKHKVAFRAWLSEMILPGISDDQALSENVLQWMRRHKIRPPGQVTLQRIVASAEQDYEAHVFSKVANALDSATKKRLDDFLRPTGNGLGFVVVKSDPGRIGLGSVMKEIEKLEALRRLRLPPEILSGLHPKLCERYRQRAATESAWQLGRHPTPIRYGLLVFFCVPREAQIIDGLLDLLLQVVHGIGVRAERKVSKELLADIRKVRGKTNILYRIAEAALGEPEGVVRDVIYPVAGQQTIEELVKEFHANGPEYKTRIHRTVYASYATHYRRMLPHILAALDFQSNNAVHQPVLRAVDVVRAHQNSKARYYDVSSVPIDGVVQPKWRDVVIEEGGRSGHRISRINYEICLLRALRECLRCKEIWVRGADRYRNPDEDLPADFDVKRVHYYESLGQPVDPTGFVEGVKESMTTALRGLNSSMPENRTVRLSASARHAISLSPIPPLEEPPNLRRVKRELVRRWPMTGLLDVLKECDLRVGFTNAFSSAASREVTDRKEVQRRLLLALYGLGTNTGLKRVSGDRHGISYKELLNIRRRYINKGSLRDSIRRVVNGVFEIREASIWGEGTTTCASDSKKFGAWDQNLMTEWHIRYGGRGVMIYWHVEKKSTCIYSQLKRCSSSEVAAMIEGVLRHCTDMEVRNHYVDSHGQSEVAFAFCHLLGFNLMPRLKAISKQRLYLSSSDLRPELAELGPILTRPIDWGLITQQYDEMIKYATALREGSAEPEAILRRFTRASVQHPTYRALAELGKAIKTTFLCSYLADESLRREIQDGLNVIENWNSANGFIFFGKSGEIATNRLDDQEASVLALHLLQVSMVYVNTLMIQKILSEPRWRNTMESRDYQALSPLVYAHVNPYGIFELDMAKRLQIAA